MSTVFSGSRVIPCSDIAELQVTEFREQLLRLVANDANIAAFFGTPGPDDGLRLIAILARKGEIIALSTLVGDSFPSLTPDCVQAHLFEREIAEQWAVTPVGHPWLKPVRFGGVIRGGAPPDISVMPFYSVQGDEVHEVAVGPVHAGIIEPGHFRFQCHGERVFHLEISLGYQHRGIERAMIGSPGLRSAALMETLAGDTSIGHCTAYSEVVEALSGLTVPARAEGIRAIALELERLANHSGDLGALANDVGFLPTSSYFGRIRGDFLNLTALLCGNRFGRGLVRPGGVRFDLEKEREANLGKRLALAAKDMIEPARLLWNTASVSGRFEGTGVVSRKTCLELGLVGPPARACGVARDVRADHPRGAYRDHPVPIAQWTVGDVFGRAMVRYYEMKSAAEFISKQLTALPQGPTETSPDDATLAPNSIAVSLVEGWRGEICHVAVTDEKGRFATYKVVDPSFHNWNGLAMALRNEQISDFPLCNKSFNLSYCGHDL